MTPFGYGLNAQNNMDFHGESIQRKQSKPISFCGHLNTVACMGEDSKSVSGWERGAQVSIFQTAKHLN